MNDETKKNYLLQLNERQYRDLKYFLESATLRGVEAVRFLDVVDQVRAAKKSFDSEEVSLQGQV